MAYCNGRRLKFLHSESGQLINEALVGILVAVILLSCLVYAIGPILSGNVKNRRMQSAIDFGKELIFDIDALSKGDWRAIYDLGKAPLKYHLILDGSSLATSSDAEFVIRDSAGIVYERYFTLQNVNRDSSNNISETGLVDPSTQKINVYVAWNDGGATSTINFSKYIMRNTKNFIFQQTDWSGGILQNSIVNIPDNRFNGASSTIDYSSSSGALRLISGDTSGVLTSSIFDSQIYGGAAFNALLWQGSVPINTTVKFQIASADSSSGPWDYIGAVGTSVDYYYGDPNTSIRLRAADHNNRRYIRYKVYLGSTAVDANPRVDDVVILYSR